MLLPVLSLLVACQPASPPSPAPSPAPTQPPSPTPVPAPFFQPLQSGPVFARGPENSWFADNVEPGAVIFYEGRFHLFFNGFADWPAKVAVGYAVSADGVNWELVSEQPILDSAQETFEGFTFFVSSVVVAEDGTWMLYTYTLDEGRDGAKGAIGRATAPGPAGPWTLDPGFVLTPGGEGAWDASRVTQPSVLRTDQGYLMFFAGADTDKLYATRMIGLATSPDGLNWTKYDDPATGGLYAQSDPVLSPGEKGEWDAFRVFQPHVVQTPDGLLMLYKSNVKIGRAEGYGLAFSQDGIRWSKYAGNPVIHEKTYPVEWLRKGYAELLYHEGTLFLYLEILEREGGAWPQGNSPYFSNIHLATHQGLP